MNLLFCFKISSSSESQTFQDANMFQCFARHTTYNSEVLQSVPVCTYASVVKPTITMKRQQIQIDGHFSVHRGPKRIELDLLQDSYKLNLIWQKASDNRVKLQL